MALPVVRTIRTVRPAPVFFADLDRQFDTVARAFFGPQYLARRPQPTRRWAPAVELTGTDEAYTLTVELPGLKRDRLGIELADDTLTITGEYGTVTHAPDGQPEQSEQEGRSEQDSQSEQGEPVSASRRSGRGEIRRTVPADVDRDGVTASLADGVLTVTLPRVAKPAARRIEIAAA